MPYFLGGACCLRHCSAAAVSVLYPSFLEGLSDLGIQMMILTLSSCSSNNALANVILSGCLRQFYSFRKMKRCNINKRISAEQLRRQPAIWRPIQGYFYLFDVVLYYLWSGLCRTSPIVVLRSEKPKCDNLPRFNSSPSIHNSIPPRMV